MAKKAARFKEGKGPGFEEEVKQVLSLMQYEILHDILICGTQIDLLAEHSNFLQKVRLIVECADHDKKVGVPLVKEKSATLGVVPKDGFDYKLLYVSRIGFTKEAIEFADNSSQIKLMTLTELESSLINFEPYARWYFQNYEKSTGMFSEGNLANNYIELNGTSIDLKKIDEPISKIARTWLSDESNNLLIVLGEFGSGKTSFCRNFAYQLLDEKYRRHQDQSYIPLLVNLRDNKRMFDLPKVLFDTIVNRFGVKLPSLMALEHFCSKRKILLILDGLDEMINKSDHEAIADCFSQVFMLSTLNAKIMVSCRSNFFKANEDLLLALKRFSVKVREPSSGSEDILSFSKHGSIVYVSELSPDKIRAYIAKQVIDPDTTLRTIAGIHDLSDLSTRPVLLNMILETLPKLEEKGSIVNSALLYEEYTNRWTARDEWRVELPLDVRQKFCVLLAWSMHSSGSEEIAITQLDELVQIVLEELPDEKDNFAKYEHDIKTCSFLVRPGAKDEFRFAHKSFLEFFAAVHFVNTILAKKQLEKTTLSDLLSRNSEKEEIRSPTENDVSQAANPWPSMLTLEIGSGKSNLLRLLWDSKSLLDSRLRSLWDRPIMIETGSNEWPKVQSRFAAVFSKRFPSDESSKVGLTEEIATFAIEIVSNRNLDPHELFSNLPEELCTVIADILRLGKKNRFVSGNREYFVEHSMKHPSQLLRTAFASSLAVSHDDLDINYVKNVRDSLEPDGWSYFLLELAARGSRYAKLFEEISDLSELRIIDKVICVHGKRGKLSRKDDESVLFNEEVAIKLLRSADRVDVQFGVELATHLDGTIAMHKALRESYKNAPREIRISILNAFAGCDSDDLCIIVRSLLVIEDDPSLRKQISKTEEQLRNRKDKQQSQRQKSHLKEAFWQRASKARKQ